MKEVFDLILESPVRALAFLLFALLVFLLDVIRRSFFRRLKDHETKMAKFETDIGNFFEKSRDSIKVHFSETLIALRIHSEDLGKATKAVNGDMLVIRESVFAIKQDIVARTHELEVYARQLESKTTALSHLFDVTVDKFDAKLVHVVNLRKELGSLHGSVEKISETQGLFRIMVGKQAEQIGSLTKIVTRHNDELKKR